MFFIVTRDRLLAFSEYFCGNISLITHVNICRIITALCAALAGLALGYAQINVDQVVRVGRNALYFEDYVLSIQYFNQAIAAKPYLAQPYFYRAVAKYSLDDMRGAEADASLAIDRNPFITDAYEIRGVARQNSGNLEGAIADYRKVLDMMPVNKGVMFNLAMAQQDAGLTDSAEVTFQRLFKLSPGYERAYMGYANLLLHKGDTVGAQTNIDKALDINRFNVGALIFHANLAMQKGKDGFATALADMDEAIRLEPRQPSFFVNRAYLRHELDDYYGAMSDFDYALQLDPVNTSAIFNRAILRAEVGDHDRAVADLDRVVSLTGGKDYRALFNRAMINKERGRLQDALSDAEVIVNAFPDMPAAYFLRFDIREAMGDKGARADYDRSIAMAKANRKAAPDDATEASRGHADDDPFFNFDPENADAVAGRFNSLVTIDTSAETAEVAGALGAASKGGRSIRGRVQDADGAVELEPLFVVTYYTSPTELRPSGDYMKEADDVNNTRVLRYLLQVTNREVALDDPADIRRHFESVDYYTSYISTHPPRAIDFFGRGMDFMTVRDYSRAAADFGEAARLSPDFTLAYFMRAIATLREAESDRAAASADDDAPSAPGAGGATPHRLRHLAARQAIADLDTVLTLSPQLAIAHYNKGVIYASQGDYTSALSALNEAIALKPEMGEAYYNRGYVYFMLGNGSAGAADLSRAGELGIVPSYSLLKRMSR